MRKLLDQFPSIRIVGDAEAATADVIVCMPYELGEPLMLPDNVLAKCTKCGHPIQHRPNNPPALLLLCLQCASTTPPEQLEALRGTLIKARGH